ncbi:MAG: terminase small subunit [Lacrimispora celerecrescens]|uniref:terminase small subunit n=1 Tax=Lacrimispora indolis TaxID=69825 RepID=UPI0004131838|nr:terminase small subunit [[Clostridium] methoxybenzovorans]MBE7721635.1 terminase small subunit [Lacrimispora celerecrescens]
MALSAKQKLFADEYLIELIVTRPYKAAYPKVKKDETAKAAASRMLTNVNVAAYVEKRMKDREKRTEITQDMVLKELAKIGFADITDFVTIESKGSYKAVQVKSPDEMLRDKLGVIAGIKEGANEIEIKLNNKEKALELIGRHLGMFKDKLEVSGILETEKTKLDDLIKQMRRGDG